MIISTISNQSADTTDKDGDKYPDDDDNLLNFNKPKAESTQ